jgi:hypothetical protein
VDSGGLGFRHGFGFEWVIGDGDEDRREVVLMGSCCGYDGLDVRCGSGGWMRWSRTRGGARLLNRSTSRSREFEY